MAKNKKKEEKEFKVKKVPLIEELNIEAVIVEGGISAKNLPRLLRSAASELQQLQAQLKKAQHTMLELEAQNTELQNSIKIAHEDMMGQCASNPIFNSWGTQVNLVKLNNAFLLSAKVSKFEALDSFRQNVQESEREKWQKDAERYRWLRTNNIVANIRFHYANGQSLYIYGKSLDDSVDYASEQDKIISKLS